MPWIPWDGTTSGQQYAYPPIAVTPGEGWETEYIHGPQPVLGGGVPVANKWSGAGHIEGVAFGGFDVHYGNQPAGRIRVYFEPRGSGEPGMWFNNKPYADPTWNDNLQEILFSQIPGFIESNLNDPWLIGNNAPYYIYTQSETTLYHPGGDLVIGVDLGGLGVWTSGLSYLGIELLNDTTGTGRLKVMTEEGWKYAIPQVGENIGRLKMRYGDGWYEMVPGRMQILTPDGWVPVN